MKYSSKFLAAKTRMGSIYVGTVPGNVSGITLEDAKIYGKLIAMEIEIGISKQDGYNVSGERKKLKKYYNDHIK